MPFDDNFMRGGGNFRRGMERARPPMPGFRSAPPGGMPPPQMGPPGGMVGPQRGVGAPGEGPGFVDKSMGDVFAGPPPAGPPPDAPAPPPVGGGEPSGIPGMGAGNEYQPGTPYEPGQSVAGDDREGRMAMMNYTAEQNAQARQENRADWSDGDWDHAISQALTPDSRPSQTKRGEWEYRVKGNWVPQGIFDDPKWRQNVFEPWQKQIQNKWRLMREKSEKWKAGRKGPGERATEARNRAIRARGGGGSMGSTSSGGGGGGYDPAMIEALLGG